MVTKRFLTCALVIFLIAPITAKPPLLYYFDACCWDHATIHLIFNMRQLVECLRQNKQKALEVVDPKIKPTLQSFIELAEAIITTQKNGSWYDETAGYVAGTTTPFMKCHKEHCLNMFGTPLTGKGEDARSGVASFLDWLMGTLGPCNEVVTHAASRDGLEKELIYATVADSKHDFFSRPAKPHRDNKYTVYVLSNYLMVYNTCSDKDTFVMTLVPYLSIPDGDMLYEYELIGLVLHRGTYHYVTLIKDQWEEKPSWWLCDDYNKKITPVLKLPTQLPGTGEWSNNSVSLWMYQLVKKTPITQSSDAALSKLSDALSALAGVKKPI